MDFEEVSTTSLIEPQGWVNQEVDLDSMAELVKGIHYDGIASVVCLGPELVQMRALFEERAPVDSPAFRLGLSGIPVLVGEDVLLRAVCDHLLFMVYGYAGRDLSSGPDLTRSPIGLGSIGRRYIKSKNIRAVMVRRSGRITIIE